MYENKWRVAAEGWGIQYFHVGQLKDVRANCYCASLLRT